MVNIDKAIEIAKKLNPDIGPSLEMARKNTPDEVMVMKLKKFFDDYERALKIVENHPGKSYQQIKEIFSLNAKAHTINYLFISSFVYNVFNRKGDLNTLAKTTARQIVLNDQRVNNFYAKNREIDPAATSKEIAREIEKTLVEYFSNLKGRKIDQLQIIESLTKEVTILVAKLLQEISRRNNE